MMTCAKKNCQLTSLLLIDNEFTRGILNIMNDHSDPVKDRSYL